MSKSTALIFGCLGETASLMLDVLRDINTKEIYGIDCMKTIAHHSEYTYINFNFLSQQLSELYPLIKRANIICICLPFSVYEHIVLDLFANINPETLLIDTFSIKYRYFQIFNMHKNMLPHSISILSLHPLFKPDLGFKNNNVIVCNIQKGVNCDSFLVAIKNKGATIILLEVEEHDKLMSLIQVAPHFLILIYAVLLKNSGLSIDKIISVSTPPVRNLLHLIARISSGNPHVYWEIQNGNMCNTDCYNNISINVEEFKALILENKKEDFFSLLESIQNFFGQENIKRFSDQYNEILKMII